MSELHKRLPMLFEELKEGMDEFVALRADLRSLRDELDYRYAILRATHAFLVRHGGVVVELPEKFNPNPNARARAERRRRASQ